MSKVIKICEVCGAVFTETEDTNEVKVEYGLCKNCAEGEEVQESIGCELEQPCAACRL